jgi:hypothetical protein
MDASTCFSVQAYLLAQTRRAFGWVLAPPVQVTLLSFDIAGNAASDPVHMALIIVSSALQEPLASSDLTTRSVTMAERKSARTDTTRCRSVPWRRVARHGR